MGRPTIWLKNESGDIWNLRPSSFAENYASLFSAISGTGFETTLKMAQIQYDFVITEETPKQVPISGTMYFASPLNMQRFSEFLGGYENTVKLYYDPEGKIDPRDQISKPWYKQVRITKLDSGEEDQTTGLFICKMTMTPLSVMWRRDTALVSSTTISEAEAHVYPFVYPYFYQNDQKLYVNILNTGERIGCEIKITNNSGSALNYVEWTVTNGERRQYAKWLASIGLENGRTLVIDSNPNTQRSVITYNSDQTDVQDYQEANPQYINFVDLFPGNNQIMFNLETISGVTIEVSYTEQVRAL